MSNYPESFVVKTQTKDGNIGLLELKRCRDGNYDLAIIVGANPDADGAITTEEIDQNIRTGLWRYEAEPMTDEKRTHEITNACARLDAVGDLIERAESALRTARRIQREAIADIVRLTTP